MRSLCFTAVSLAILSPLVSSKPLWMSFMGSRHNLYLVTCTRTSDDSGCSSPRYCSPENSAPAKYTAVAYFANGPIETSQSLTDISTVSRPAQPWEGTQRVAKLGKSSAFSSRIAAEAAGMKKGEIAGTAVLDNEDFICFKDGSISFVVDDELSHQPYACKTDYWCPSILV